MRHRLIAGLFLLAGAGIIGAVALRPVPPRPIIGMVRATEIKIAPEVSGHIADLPVKAGEHVAAGTVIAVLSNPELDAAVGEAEAAVLEAKAARDRVYAGIRQEEVDIAAHEIQKANADVTLAQQQYRRVSELAATAHASQQQLDNARAAVAVTVSRLKSAELSHAEAQSGPTQEERSKADAAVAAAQASLAVVQRRQEKLQIKAPADGVVEVVVAELGEATVPGRTILTITDAGKPWFNFNIREDQLHGLGIGSQMTLIEGKDNRQLTAHISEMRRLGDFATLGRAWAASGRPSALLEQLPAVRGRADRLELLEQHRIWARSVEATAAAQPIRRPDPRPRDGRIRLGLMSADLRDHPVGYFALPLFDHRDAGRFELFCYSFFRGEADRAQSHFAQRATAFRKLPDATTREAAQIIADDRLDMLIELGGSTDMNRPEVMAYRPAPIQASWLGYPHSTGLAAIDHFICDPFTRPGDPALLAETALVMPKSWVAFSPAVFTGSPAVDPTPPRDRTGWITFGTANNPYKYNRATIGAWARAVAAVPDSRFMIVRPEAGSESFRRNLEQLFAAQGVDPARLDFRPVRGGQMALYNQIDISLDTFPLTGGTTTVEALWMGTPVVSLRGEAFYERLSHSILSNVGLADLVADDVDGFVEIAARLAADGPRRAALRATLREQVSQSPLGQAETFARDFYEMIAARVGAS